MVILLRLIPKERLSLMNELRNDNNGFTLIEVLIVLTVVIILGSIVWSNSSKIYERKVMDQFLRQLQHDLLFVQQYAMVHQKTVYIYWYPNQSYYEAELTALDGDLFERKYDSAIQVKSMTMKFPITYKPNGSIERGGTIYIQNQDEAYKLIFSIGKGRFRLEKL